MNLNRVAAMAATTLAAGALAACGADRPTSVADPAPTPAPLASVVTTYSYPTSATGVTPTPIAGNTGVESCPTGSTGYKLNDPQGTGTVLGIPSITFSISDNRQFLSWTTSGLYVMRAVFMKGGEDSHRYDYNPPPRTADQNLASPLNSGGNIPQISHFTFCYEQIQPARASGTKYHDLNANGAVDAGEPGLPGWTFYVDYDDDGILDTGEPSALSNASGAWEITGSSPERTPSARSRRPAGRAPSPGRARTPAR
jgi:hypothetical protein